MKTTIFLLISFIATTLMFSCKKTAQHSAIAYQLKTTNRTSTIARMQSTITWTSGYASAKEIKFEAQDSLGHVEFKSDALQKIDLFSPLSSLGNLSVTPGVYKEVEFELELVPTATDAAFELKGTYNSTPVVFRVDSALQINGEQANVTIADEKTYTSVTALNLANLITGITAANLDAATKDSTGAIIISASSNSSLYATMLNNLQHSEQEDFHE